MYVRYYRQPESMRVFLRVHRWKYYNAGWNNRDMLITTQIASLKAANDVEGIIITM